MGLQGHWEANIYAKIKYINKKESITFPNANLVLKESVKQLEMKMLKLRYYDYRHNINILRPIDHMYAILEIKVDLRKSVKVVKAVKFVGKWNEILNRKIETKSFMYVKRPTTVNEVKKSPTESNKNLKVMGKADMISVKGDNSGEIIRVYYFVSGEEVSSVIARGDEVDIRLQKNQKYIIKVEQKSIKVAL